jgi:hypothetical protein
MLFSTIISRDTTNDDTFQNGWNVMTPEKILELLPIAEIIHENGCQCADCEESIAYNNQLKDCANALAGKVVAKEDLLTEDEKYKIISPLLPSGISRGDVLRICKALDEAQHRKANRED